LHAKEGETHLLLLTTFFQDFPMLQTIEAELFFKGDRPPGIPADAAAPDWNALPGHAQSLASSGFSPDVLKTILERENTRTGAGEKALESIRSIDVDTLFIVAGQQAGLFGGPLYTMYKAIHVIRLSARLSEALSRNVVPVFWIASDDHDLDEVKSLGLRTPDGSPFRVEYTPAAVTPGIPVGEIVLVDSIAVAIETLAARMTPGERADTYLGIIRSAWQPGIKWSDAFARQMAALFSSWGLVLLDPRWKGIKPLFSGIMSRELEDPLASSKLVNEEADRAGSSAARRKALRKPENSTNLFFETDDGVRNPVLWQNETFSAGQSRFSKAELLSLLESAPERFSPGAALRPVCQDFLLPAAALIAGPGERIYLEQIAPLYTYFKVNRSIIWPRASFTLLDKKSLRTAEKEKVSLDIFFRGADRIKTELAKKSFPPELKLALDTLSQTTTEGFDRVAAQIRSLDPSLVEMVEKEKGKALHIIEGISDRALRAHKSDSSLAETRTRSAAYFLSPQGGAQERWFGMDAIYPALGEDGLKEMMERTSPGEEKHRVVKFKDEG
jgi:bacillithiol synthase